MINEKPHKQDEQDGRKILWFNGKKWLVRETCKTLKEARELLKQVKQINDQHNNPDKIQA